MKKDICFILLFLFVTASSAFAQLIGFESSEVPEAFKTSGKGAVSYTHLDVYKRQILYSVPLRNSTTHNI